GLFVAHHAPPFRLTRNRVADALVDPTKFNWWDQIGDEPTVEGSFADVVVSSVLDAMVQTAEFGHTVEPEPGEVLYEFTNFEQVALGTRDNGWILCFERGIDGMPQLVGLMRRGVVNRASLALQPV
ncbi:MAG: hypothetical protein OEX04_19430, partial [Acidimicrobiia bacterium]|nr:hypothetical protein [Acidimicrobiia bacterium]